jgi:hypothetical protein
MKLLRILTVAVIITFSAFGQTNDTTYSLTTEIGLGYSRYFTTMDFSNLNKNGFSGTLRVMWNPEHLLSIGFETGYQRLYSIDVNDQSTEFGTTDFSASMTAVPISAVFAMKLSPNIRLLGGSGMYLLFNNGEIFGDVLESSQISIGMFAGISYSYPITNTITVGGELLYSYYSKIQDQTVALQFLFVYKFLEY